MVRKLETTRFKNAKVFYRIYPMVRMQWEYVKILDDMKSVYMRYLQDFGAGKEGVMPSYWKFETDGIFYNNTQEEIYDTIMAEVMDKVIEGHNGIILCYGQTGSGKSLTASGLQNCYNDRGITPRLISEIFQKKELLTDQKMCIQMSYIETQKGYFNDLLNPSTDILDIHELKNVKHIKVKNELAALKLLFTAEGRRQFSNDCLFSHAANGVFTLHILLKPLNQTDAVIKISKIHVVDLGGADTCGNLTCFHKNEYDVGNANLAKTQLEQFVLVLCQNIPENIIAKHRLNLLIQYLADSLNNYSILRCIGHIRTDKDNLLITISMLRFGQIVRGLKPKKLKKNVIKEEETTSDPIQEELKKIQIERDIEVMLMNQSLSTNITQERIKHMQNVAAEYLQDKTNELVVLNVTDANTVLKVFKNLYNKLEAEKTEETKRAYQRAYEDALNIKSVSTTESTMTKTSRKNGVSPFKFGESIATITSGNESPRKSYDRRISKMSSRQKHSASSFQGSDTGSRAGKSGVSLLKRPQNQSTASRMTRRSKTSSTNTLKKSGSKRKSVSSVTIGTEGIASILEEVPLPDGIPQREEAWQSFITDENYQEIFNIAHNSKENAQNAHQEYLDEVKSLQRCHDVVDLRKFELKKAQMLRMFNKEQVDEDGVVITSDLEKQCLENITKAQDELVQQQEKTLKSQTEFCIMLGNYQNAKSIVNEKFEVFCMEKFQTSAPHLDLLSEKATEKSFELNLTTDDEPELVTSITSSKQAEVEFYESLKQILTDQIRKKFNERIRNKKWVQSCKK